jgi:hypothetical protein
MKKIVNGYTGSWIALVRVGTVKLLDIVIELSKCKVKPKFFLLTLG